MIAEHIIADIKRKDLKEFLATTEGLSFNGNNACLCPFHDDHHPSLTVTQKDSGIWAWYCHSCNIGGSNIDFIMHKHGMGFLEASTFLQGHYHLEEKPKKITAKNTEITENDIQRKHDYLDSDGNFIWQKIKLRDGSFRCRQKENGKWIFSLDGIAHIPYRWSEIKDESIIYLCEGEKDADTMIHLGYHATTSPFGKGNFPDNLVPFFTDKEVNIVYDVGNDKDAEETASKLLGVCSQIWILKLPLQKEEADITDYVNQFEDDDTKRTKLLDLPGTKFDETQVRPAKQNVHHDEQEDEGMWAQTVKYIREDTEHSQKFSHYALCQQVGAFQPSDKKKVSNAIGYLVKKGEVTKGGEIGSFSKAPADLVELDLFPDETEEYFEGFTVPLLGEEVKIARGDVILIGGFTSTGKTCMGLNFVIQNQTLFPAVDYYSSQAGQVRYRLRAFKTFQNIEKEHWKMKLFERTEDYSTLINPENLTIIDFLDEKEGNYQEMGGRLSRIHDKIENKSGIVVVFMQKHPGRLVPYGNFQTLSYSNCAVMLDDLGDEVEKQKQLTVVKSKMSPNTEGRVIRYKIESEGTKMVALSPLEYPSRLDTIKRRFCDHDKK